MPDRQTELLATDTPALFRAAVERAAEMLRRGDVVAVPTETVYGLAADARNADAVARVFQVKGRPANNPIIVHVMGHAMVQSCVAEWPKIAEDLARSFWPGPLTLVVRKSAAIPAIVTAGGETVGIRWPSHPFMQALIRECDFPIAAPSANPSGQISPTTAEHVQRSLAGRIPLIIDGGPSHVGIESTVVDLTTKPPRILRPGIIHAEAIEAVTGTLSAASPQPFEMLKSPGLLQKHYSPRAKVVVLSWADDSDLLKQLAQFAVKREDIRVIAHHRIPSFAAQSVGVVPHDSEAFARALYAEFHRCDAENAKLVVVEAVPQTVEWYAIADRLQRASAD